VAADTSTDGWGQELVFCSATLIDRAFPEKVQAAATAGFTAISVLVADYLEAQATGMTDRQFATLFTDAGLRAAEVSSLTRWTADDDAAHADEDFAFGLVELVGATGVNCTVLGAPLGDLDQAVTTFGALCDRAARHGIRCHVEFFPWTDLPTLNVAWELVRRADRPNAGIMFDTWHHARSGGTVADLAAIPPDRIFGIQLCDTRATFEGTLLEDTQHRLLPGQGTADVVSTVRQLRAMGVTAVIGGEVLSPEWSGLTSLEVATRLYDSMRDVVDRAGEVQR
jgi:sugar phosphate isomerase/epimerase